MSITLPASSCKPAVLSEREIVLIRDGGHSHRFVIARANGYLTAVFVLFLEEHENANGAWLPENSIDIPGWLVRHFNNVGVEEARVRILVALENLTYGGESESRNSELFRMRRILIDAQKYCVR